jgi:hypothetical protein
METRDIDDVDIVTSLAEGSLRASLGLSLSGILHSA